MSLWQERVPLLFPRSYRLLRRRVHYFRHLLIRLRHAELDLPLPALNSLLQARLVGYTPIVFRSILMLRPELCPVFAPHNMSLHRPLLGDGNGDDDDDGDGDAIVDVPRPSILGAAPPVLTAASKMRLHS